MRALVAITSYGTANDQYLARVVDQYRSMTLDVDIVVLSNVFKTVPPNVELIVGLPTKNPWSLPFAHKKILADRMSKFDLFVYSEDDILITESNIQAFLRMSSILPAKEIPGFLRFEIGPDGKRSYPEFHANFRWDPCSVRTRGNSTFAFFTNEHAACYVLTRSQLSSAVESGGFLVEPHQGNYDLACTAATDPYTQCGFQKMICISAIDKFLVHHASNKYAGTRYGVDELEFRRQIKVLSDIEVDEGRPVSLFNAKTKLGDAEYSKDLYEPARQELETLIPKHVKTVLSIGCGWGATEAWLSERGLQVTAVPLDQVIPGRAQAAGVEVVHGNLEAVRKQLASRKFDCLLLLNVLHLLEEPVSLISSFKQLLSDGSVIISLLPNMARTRKFWTKAGREHHLSDISYQASGAHFVSHKVVRRWFDSAGTKVTKTVNVLAPHAQAANRLTLGLADSFLSLEFFSLAETK